MKSISSLSGKYIINELDDFKSYKLDNLRTGYFHINQLNRELDNIIERWNSKLLSTKITSIRRFGEFYDNVGDKIINKNRFIIGIEFTDSSILTLSADDENGLEIIDFVVSYNKAGESSIDIVFEIVLTLLSKILSYIPVLKISVSDLYSKDILINRFMKKFNFFPICQDAEHKIYRRNQFFYS